MSDDNVLIQLQFQFQQYLYQQDLSIVPYIVNTNKVSATTRLDIYANAYRMRLMDVLSYHFPILHSILGNEQFHDLAEQYIKTHPSLLRSVRHYGQQLETYLKSNHRYQPHDYLSELAKVEWTFREVFDAADATSITADAFANILPGNWPDMILILHPTVRLLTLHWNVIAVQDALERNQTPPDFERHPEPTHWIIWRKDLETHYYSCTADTFQALSVLALGKTFAEMCMVLCDFMESDAVPMRAANLLKQWASEGLLTQIK